MVRGSMFAIVAMLGVSVPVAANAARPPRWVRDATPASDPAVPEDCSALVLFDRTEIRFGRDLEVSAHRQQLLRVVTSDGVPYASLGIALEPGAALVSLAVYASDRGDSEIVACGQISAVE